MNGRLPQSTPYGRTLLFDSYPVVVASGLQGSLRTLFLRPPPTHTLRSARPSGNPTDRLTRKSPASGSLSRKSSRCYDLEEEARWVPWREARAEFEREDIGSLPPVSMMCCPGGSRRPPDFRITWKSPEVRSHGRQIHGAHPFFALETCADWSLMWPLVLQVQRRGIEVCPFAGAAV